MKGISAVYLMFLFFTGCVANKTPSVPREIVTKVSKLSEGMSRKQVDALIEPPTNNYVVLVVSGFAPEYRLLATGYKVRLDFSVKNMDTSRGSVVGEDVLYIKPRTILVKTGTDWLGREKWKEVTLENGK